MRRFSSVVAGLAFAGVATLGGLSVAGPASAGGGPLVDVTVEDILSGNEIKILNDVTLSVAAVACGIDVNVLSAVLTGSEQAKCDAYSIPLVKNAWVKK